ncbi:hypothetical protein F7725_015253 [Dissostichus mawsoni]|uniref:B box-type domain-containing protein n=1 Tax=Dissostichus mawsoni TaxID=36200 RepID=A0A7J5YGX4_DISMA|nr:hypothetical protein F7725_015253 [Dissostichus mawsoni]
MSPRERRWDGEKQKKKYSCPQCRQTFKQRPVLVKNVMLADFVEELKEKKTEPQAGPSDPCDAGPGDVGCDACSPPGRKRKALKSCLQCRVSFCEQHLQPHYEVPFKKHKLIEASKLQENICSQHDMVMEIFCLTDQQVICSLCLNDEHKEHDIVSAAAEMSKKKKELGVSRKTSSRESRRREVVKVLQPEVEASISLLIKQSGNVLS